MSHLYLRDCHTKVRVLDTDSELECVCVRVCACVCVRVCECVCACAWLFSLPPAVSPLNAVTMGSGTVNYMTWRHWGANENERRSPTDNIIPTPASRDIIATPIYPPSLSSPFLPDQKKTHPSSLFPVWFTYDCCHKLHSFTMMIIMIIFSFASFFFLL